MEELIGEWAESPRMGQLEELSLMREEVEEQTPKKQMAVSVGLYGRPVKASTGRRRRRQEEESQVEDQEGSELEDPEAESADEEKRRNSNRKKPRGNPRALAAAFEQGGDTRGGERHLGSGSPPSPWSGALRCWARAQKHASLTTRGTGPSA